MLEIKRLEPSELGEEKRYFCEHEGQTCEVYLEIRKIPEEWIEPLWEAYDNSLHIEEAIQEQSCYSKGTFASALRDTDYNKAVLVVDRMPSGLMLGTNNLEKARVAYINPNYIRKSFPKDVEEGRFFYVTCLFISPHVRNVRFVNLLLKACIDGVSRKNYVIASDASDSRLFLPDYIVKVSEEIGLPLEKLYLGSQSYFAWRMRST